MTIVGIGSDLINIERISKTIKRYEMRFLKRIFSASEIAYAQKKAKPAAVYAKTFAAKEAALKALGTGLAKSISWQDIEVKHYLSGKPYVIFKDNAYAYLQAMLLPKYQAVIHLTLTDDYPWAQAFVVIESFPESSSIELIEANNKKRYGNSIKMRKYKHIN